MKARWWAPTAIIVSRSLCRLRWFRLAGLPVNERLDALRLQAQAWRPFDVTMARLVLVEDQGLVIAWDGADALRRLQEAGMSPERCQWMPESLLQEPGADGLRLVQVADGFEAQAWQAGWLRASRWWAAPLTSQDWQEFVHASGLGPEAQGSSELPTPQHLPLSAAPWARHHALDASGDGADAMEQRIVFAGALALTLTLGALGHQAWDAHREARSLAQQIAEVKATTAPVIAARDATMAVFDEVDKLGAWFALPLPIDVIRYLHDALGRSGAQIKDLELEGDKLRLALQLGATASRAAVVKDLQAGGWFTDVAEVRADSARGLVAMEMRINGIRPPVVDPADAAPAVGATGTAPAPAANAPAAVKVPAPAVTATPSTPTPAPAPVPAPRDRQSPPQPAKPIIAKPDANGMPPPDVFNAIPNR